MRKFLFGAVAAFFIILAPSDTRAQIAYFYTEQPELNLDNDNVEMKISVAYAFKDGSSDQMIPKLCVRVKNKTDKMLYIDLGNSFMTMNDETRCYYIPSSSSTTEGKAVGVGVNVGLVNVGSVASSSHTTTTFAQRIIAVPPLSTKNLEQQPIFVAPMPDMAVYINRLNGLPEVFVNTKKHNRVPEGESWTFGSDDSPLHLSAMITCSFDENCTDKFMLRRGCYVNRTACYKNFGIAGWGVYTGAKKQDKLLKVFPEWHSWGDFFLLMVGFQDNY